MFVRRLHKLAQVILIIPALATAECYQESVTYNSSVIPITEIADYKRFVKTLDNNQQVCTVLFRAKIDNRWHDGRGESVGLATDSTDQLCSQALNSGRRTILEQVNGANVVSTQTLYCNDFDLPKIRKGLRTGDTFKVSELKPHTDPQKQGSFVHKGAECRYFLESDLAPGAKNLIQWQIVGCIIHNEWTVVDKF